MILETVQVGELGVNCYILASAPDRSAVIIDPGSDEDKIKRVLEKNRLKPAFIINTHSHFDHIGCDDKFGVMIYIHRLDAGALKDAKLNFSAFLQGRPFSVKSEIKTLNDKNEIVLDDIKLEVIHTPGHTPGGICLLVKEPATNILFSGDTLFCESVGRTDVSGANELTLLKSIKERLFILPDEVNVYPGHGPFTTIGHEKKHNPFLN